MRDINKKFSVRYYLNLVLIDEEERRYFKQQVREDEFPSAWNGCFGSVNPGLVTPHGVHTVYISSSSCVFTPFLLRKSHYGGKATWRGRACPIRPLSPLRGSRDPRLLRARWNRPPRKRAARGAAPLFNTHQRLRQSVRDTRQLYNIWLSSCFCFFFPSLIAAVGMKKGGSREHWNSLHEAFRVASGCWSVVSFVFYYFLMGIRLIHCLTL